MASVNNITATVRLSDHRLLETVLRVPRGGIYEATIRFVDDLGNRDLIADPAGILLRFLTPDGTPVEDVNVSQNWVIEEGSNSYKGSIDTAGPIGGHIRYNALQAQIIWSNGVDVFETLPFAVLFGDFGNTAGAQPTIVAQATSPIHIVGDSLTRLVGIFLFRPQYEVSLSLPYHPFDFRFDWTFQFTAAQWYIDPGYDNLGWGTVIEFGRDGVAPEKSSLFKVELAGEAIAVVVDDLASGGNIFHNEVIGDRRHGVLQHYTITRTASNGRIQIWVNGEMVREETGTVGELDEDSEGFAYIGSDKDGSSNRLNAALQRIRFFERVLTPEEIVNGDPAVMGSRTELRFDDYRPGETPEVPYYPYDGSGAQVIGPSGSDYWKYNLHHVVAISDLT